VLCDLEEHTDLEVSVLLDIPLGTVKSRLRLARRKFRLLAEQTSLASVALAASEGGSP